MMCNVLVLFAEEQITKSPYRDVSISISSRSTLAAAMVVSSRQYVFRCRMEIGLFAFALFVLSVENVIETTDFRFTSRLCLLSPTFSGAEPKPEPFDFKGFGGSWESPIIRRVSFSLSPLCKIIIQY